MSTVQPLSGITVVDFTQVFMGPSCTQLLGDYGADVIKVERPGTGDIARTSIPDPAGLDNPIFLSINRNKRSISIDTRTEEASRPSRSWCAAPTSWSATSGPVSWSVSASVTRPFGS